MDAILHQGVGAFCSGQIVPIAQNTALFSLLGTTYGGNGTSTFAYPDLRGRVPIGQGQGPGLSPYVLGEQSGIENVTILSAEMPAHNHGLRVANTSSNLTAPAANCIYCQLCRLKWGWWADLQCSCSQHQFTCYYSRYCGWQPASQ